MNGNNPIVLLDLSQTLGGTLSPLGITTNNQHIYLVWGDMYENKLVL